MRALHPETLQPPSRHAPQSMTELLAALEVTRERGRVGDVQLGDAQRPGAGPQRGESAGEHSAGAEDQLVHSAHLRGADGTVRVSSRRAR